MIVLGKPQELFVKLYAVDGEELCEYVSSCFDDECVTESDVEEILRLQVYPELYHSELIIDLAGLHELIIEEEDYCNEDSIESKILEFIAEEFGGHFNINFLSVCAYV